MVAGCDGCVSVCACAYACACAVGKRTIWGGGDRGATAETGDSATLRAWVHGNLLQGAAPAARGIHIHDMIHARAGGCGVGLTRDWNGLQALKRFTSPAPLHLSDALPVAAGSLHHAAVPTTSKHGQRQVHHRGIGSVGSALEQRGCQRQVMARYLCRPVFCGDCLNANPPCRPLMRVRAYGACACVWCVRVHVRVCACVCVRVRVRDRVV